MAVYDQKHLYPFEFLKPAAAGPGIIPECAKFVLLRAFAARSRKDHIGLEGVQSMLLDIPLTHSDATKMTSHIILV